ncbi:hypothetical protein QOZ98_000338 [Planomicrobium stackebrandtii]|uniref:Uncharacterized protein n=1 Tax=Planomicrobium stackebrandtii TaxID=253160 RepID=A0ABU0GQF2_9BACL|nr:hypothetical protein [Planomicrobium stackebrandtii]MDQ0427513.1 hypothetical protein [Planomicrobium stackebrandtii]
MDQLSETKTMSHTKTTVRKETPPDFSQFRGERLDKEPSRILELLGYLVWFCAGAGILLAMIYSLFYFV